MTNGRAQKCAAKTALPTAEQVGEVGSWRLTSTKTGTEPHRDFDGRFLGLASNRRYDHHDHDGRRTFVRDGTTCRACRWREIRIFRDDDSGCFVLHQSGHSIIPGETIYTSYQTALSGHEAIERLKTYTAGREGSYLGHVASMALAQAAGLDPTIESAWINR